MFSRFEEIVATAPSDDGGELIELGRSRDGAPVLGNRFGRGPRRISLLAGCHADEPVGPRLLRHLSRYLSRQSDADEMLARYQWWIVPHINPDGERRNITWSDGAPASFDLSTYLEHVVRELPGDDIEFGFPRGDGDTGARPEPTAVRNWWQQGAPFDCHVSLHGMAFAAGPWFLIEPTWVRRSTSLMQACRDEVARLGYALHDVQRHGEKGFHRIDRGFCTRPDSAAMIEHFEALEDPDTAALFRPSSMETIRSLGGDPLTLVSEMPLFILRGVGETVEPFDAVADEWRSRIEGWRERVRRGEDVSADVPASGVTAMPVLDQMRLQWRFITAGIEAVTAAD